MASRFALARARSKKRKLLSPQHVEILLAQADAEIKSTPDELDEAHDLARKAGLTIESDLPAILKSHREGTLVESAAGAFTGGHSNTDHVVLRTGDYVTDRIAELRRGLITRSRAQLPESKGEERWDKPRIPGERRRRIVREKDLPSAPPEPGPSGYVIFVGQMTVKIRHDRPNEPHKQTKVVQEISKMWRVVLTDEDRKFYNDFADEARREYRKQNLEFRATGQYTPSDRFEKISGAGLWVHKRWHEKNALEREIASYDTVVFPPRPPEMDEDYWRRDRESKERRKIKLKQQAREIAERKRKVKEKEEKAAGKKGMEMELPGNGKGKVDSPKNEECKEQNGGAVSTSEDVELVPV